ncbi:MAG TPA: acetyl-CoA carboxylase biotin carboxyl carrier protein [Terrisporobacter glycolicus]|uniref:acetyl-CoA carboxylase biotin carboxyl carrier protein n=1 Tax=Terrisporobacter TaxID=1505652 RepID=UPI000E94F203|nr:MULTISPECIES: acetyl-CoA carboxylase biotin carboxyl carrier protein [Terrisporobacter]MBN9648163.1 acetyl-CoA carboxylase biotin carboxyl carrier protein [Terrisporobacter glycolicus]HBI92349.1 acetyl-CoA carboxylase biotin carboxyl carrier protein [Terrisporobacter hibernicus]
MRFDEVKELIELINSSNLSYFEMRDEKEFIKMDKSITRNYSSNNNDLCDNNSKKIDVNNSSNDADIKTEFKENVEENNVSENSDDATDMEVISSPIVGTFYEAMSPDDGPFVSIGQKISKGEVVCIVEAMKLMNEISAEFDCEIVSVLSENGKMVQYGEPLFKVRRV